MSKKYPIHSPGEWVWIRIWLATMLLMLAYAIWTEGWPNWLRLLLGYL